MKMGLKGMQERMIQRLGAERGKPVADAMVQEYRQLCRRDAQQPRDLLRHLHNNIYPAAAAFRALMKAGVPRGEASQLAQSAFLDLMEAPAAAIRRLCRIPGFYRRVPVLFGKFMPKLFKKEAGFDFVYYPTDRNRVRFDMRACPYERTCRELDCAELAPVFCAADDVCYGHMHPALCWNRTQTIARGGCVCDFDLEVKTVKRP